MELGKKIRHLWNLDEDIFFLNHGSFGAAPKVVLEAADKWLKKAEAEPVRFFVDEYFELVRKTACRFAEFTGCDGDDLTFVDNATTGVNTVLSSLRKLINPGDEILITNHVYPAVRNAVNYFSEIYGAKVVEAIIPFPLQSSEELISSFSGYLTSKTKLAVIDHITSVTAVIFPVKKLTELCHQNNTLVLIDGAHAPGMIDLNISEINPDWYTGNLHKWLYTIQGAAILYTAKKHQGYTKPLAISLFYNQGFTTEFDWTGTKNPAPVLSANDALDFYLNIGRDNITGYMHSLVLKATKYLNEHFKLESLVPEEMTGSISTLKFPGKFKATHDESVSLRKLLLNKYKTELFVSEFSDNLYFRISAQIYNFFDEYIKLAEILNIIGNE